MSGPVASLRIVNFGNRAGITILFESFIGVTAILTPYLLAALFTLLLALYVLRWRNHDAEVWSAPAAWARWGLYCLVCIGVADVTGALSATFANFIVTPEQWQDPVWWISTLVLLIFIVNVVLSEVHLYFCKI